MSQNNPKGAEKASISKGMSSDAVRQTSGYNAQTAQRAQTARNTARTVNSANNGERQNAQKSILPKFIQTYLVERNVAMVSAWVIFVLLTIWLVLILLLAARERYTC